MPRGPQGQKRPADAIARAIMVAKIATGEVSDPVIETGAGKKAGALARNEALSKDRRSEIAKLAAEARWRKNGGD
jgi:hypothetical protein